MESRAGCARSCEIVGGPEVVALVRVVHSGESVLCRIGDGVTVHCGQKVVVPTRYGRDLAEVLGPVSEEGRSRYGDMVALHRIATDADVEKDRAHEEDAVNALELCRKKVAEHDLPMTLVSAHYVLDEQRLVFFFTAETRVDFRDLVKDLVSEFHVRIELRQIGVRDESRILGGLGVCGRVLCCHGVSDKLKPVSIKMAKVQNLSLNSMKISGPCGRLLCCLEYEFEFYREEKRGLPNVGTRVKYDGTLFRITDVNVLTQRIRIEGEDRVLDLPARNFHQDGETQRWNVTIPAEE